MGQETSSDEEEEEEETKAVSKPTIARVKSHEESKSQNKSDKDGSQAGEDRFLEDVFGIYGSELDISLDDFDCMDKSVFKK
jgi:hypothetical protein